MKAWQSAALRLLYVLGLAVTPLPRALEVWAGPPLGRLLLRLYRRRSVALENIRNCYPKMPEPERLALLTRNFEHYGMLVFELLHLFSPVPGHYRRYALKNSRLTGLENWQRANALGKGVLFVSSHLGNWELMVAAGGLAGIPVTMVTKHLKPEWLHKRIESARLSCGVRAAYEPRPLPLILKAFRAKGSVGFVMDQYAGPPIGIPVRFFGVKVGTLAAVSTLAKRTGAAIVMAKTRRDERGIVHVHIEPMLDLTDIIDDEEKTTELIAGQVETWVRENPSQWLWIHRRFKKVVWDAQIP